VKIREMIERRSALDAESKTLLASDAFSIEQEARANDIANEMAELDAKIRASQVRERFASAAVVSKTMQETRDMSERAEDWRASKEYREQFIGYLRGGRAPEMRELISTASSSVLIPKVYEESLLKYIDANTVVRNLADIKTGVQGYPTLRYNRMKSADYTSAWANVDSNSPTTAATDTDPTFQEVPIAPIPLLPKTQVSQQLIRQANFDVEAEVMDHLQRQMAKNLEWGYVGGTGTASPTGIFTTQTYNATTNPINITSATSAGTSRAGAITAGATLANLLNMRYTKLPAAYWGSSAWIFPQDTYAAIAGLTNNGVPIFVPSADAAGVQAAPFTLMGLPVYVTEYLPAHVATATTGKNTIAVLGTIRDGYAVREWGGVGMIRDEITAASSARVIFQAMAFANAAFTRTNALVQLQVTNA
jgi:HK97 family phage major capsid protein